MNQATHDKIVSFIWGIADDVLHDPFKRGKYQAIVAFSGEHEYGGAKMSKASLNGFSSSDIAEKSQTDPYRFVTTTAPRCWPRRPTRTSCST